MIFFRFIAAGIILRIATLNREGGMRKNKGYSREEEDAFVAKMEKKRKEKRKMTEKDCQKYSIRDLEMLETAGRVILPPQFQQRVQEYREVYGGSEVDEVDQLRSTLKGKMYKKKLELDEKKKKRDNFGFNYNKKYQKLNENLLKKGKPVEKKKEVVKEVKVKKMIEIGDSDVSQEVLDLSGDVDSIQGKNVEESIQLGDNSDFNQNSEGDMNPKGNNQEKVNE